MRSIRYLRLVCLCVLCVSAAFVLSACTSTVEGLRFAPGEEQKQAAQAARDTALGGRLVGIPPGSDAAKMLADAAPPAAAYMGPPKKPIDVMPALVTASKQWKALEGQLAAFKLRGRIGGEVSLACKQAMAGLMAKLVEAKKTVKAGELLPIAQAIVTMESIGRRMVDAVEVPEAELSEAELKQSAEVRALTATVGDLADQLAARQVTWGDVGDKAAAAIDDAATRAGGWYDTLTGNPVLSGLAGLLGLGTIGGWLRSRSKQKEADTAYDELLAAERARQQPAPLDLAAVLQLLGRQAQPAPAPTTPAPPPAA